jgi:membrane protease YdiL (CAAX protease family)
MASLLATSWAVIVLVAAPVAGFLARRPLAAREKSRLVIYAGSGINLIVIGGITAAIDFWSRGEAIRALTPTLSPSRFFAWAIASLLGCLAISIGVYFLRAKLNRPPSAIVMSLLPQTWVEKTSFLVVCVLVGVVEEFIFRGFTFFTLARLLQNNTLAVAIVTVSFALQHGIQDAIGIARAFVLGGVLAIPVLVTGSLLPSIVAHAAVDAFSGLFGPSIMKRFEIRRSK